MIYEAPPRILKKSGCLVCTIEFNSYMQIMMMNRLYTLNSFSYQLYFNNNANSINPFEE